MQKILPLESLRGLAALSVVLFHFDIGSHLNGAFSRNAWLMVDFFFVLSGFVMALSYTGRIGTWAELARFKIRRVLRLYPLHLLVLMMFVGLELLKVLLVALADFNTMSEPFTGSRDLVSLLPNLLLVQNLVLERLTWNYPSWSISAEVFTYVIFGLVTLFVSARYGMRGRLIAIAVLCLASQIILQIHGMGTTNLTGPARCVFAFFLGVLVFDIHTTRARTTIPGLGALACLISVAVVWFADHLPLWALPCVPLVFAATIYGITRSDPKSLTYKALSLRPLVFLGTISYGIYMWHALVLYVIAVSSRILFGVPFAEGTSGVTLDYPTLLIRDLVTLLALAITVVMAYLSYRFFETRFLKR